MGVQTYGCQPKNRGVFPQTWMVKIMVPNPIKMDDLGVPTPSFGNTFKLKCQDLKVQPAFSPVESTPSTTYYVLADAWDVELRSEPLCISKIP